MKNNILFLLSFLFAQTLLAQGPIDGYMKAGGEVDIAVSYGFDKQKKYYLGDQLQDTFNRTYQTAGVFLAYGFDENLGLVASVPFMWTDGDNRGFQDGQFFLKYRPYSKATESQRLDVILAGGVTTALSRYPISPESDNPIGERPTIFEARTVVQLNKYDGFFISAKAGVSYKIKPITQVSIPTLVRAGYATGKIYTDFWLEGVFAIGAEANTVALGQQGSTFLKFGGTVYLPIGKMFGVFVNGAYTPWGRNIGISPRLGTGFVLKFQTAEKN